MDILSELEGKEYTKKIYEDYDIRFCREDEYEDLKVFLRNHWNKNHIFVLSKDIFDFQHLDQEKHRYNYVIARHRDDHAIHAILGFIPTSQFDKKINRIMIWPCIWKNRDDVKRKGLGVTMYHFLKTNIRIETISILGISEIALNIYKHWNFTTGKMKQFVMPNFRADEYLASGLKEVYPRFYSSVEDTNLLAELDISEYISIPEDAELFGEYSEYKSKTYYINRFIKHPIYNYFFIAIKESDVIKAIIIARKCGNELSNCLRIVDYIGKIAYLPTIRNQLQLYLERNNYEYVDFVEAGIDDKVLESAGFINRNTYDRVIVPNYFEPFIKKNIDIDFAFKTVVPNSKMIFFKADADQDRPCIIR